MPSASLSIRSPAIAVEAARRAAKAEPRRLQPVARAWKGLIAASPAKPHYVERSSYAAPGREATGGLLPKNWRHDAGRTDGGETRRRGARPPAQAGRDPERRRGRLLASDAPRRDRHARTPAVLPRDHRPARRRARRPH